ncbi:PIN domain-containing protein [Marinactinospora rubrisoli]|uniref:PIN domain-containing protein n=1 Tax=Marinactinospora rubrisoli TaxID=2715399 RepID=A0ABW2KA49_9ACTN
MSAHGYVLDSGVLIAIEKGRSEWVRFLDRSRRMGDRLLVSAGVVAQVWRAEPNQARIGWLLKLRNVEVVSIDGKGARLIGHMLRDSGTSDIVDAHVTLLAFETRWPVLTSDPHDLRKLHPDIRIQEV